MTNAPTSARKNHANAHIDNGVDDEKLTFFRKPLKDAATEMDPISVS